MQHLPRVSFLTLSPRLRGASTICLQTLGMRLPGLCDASRATLSQPRSRHPSHSHLRRIFTATSHRGLRQHACTRNAANASERGSRGKGLGRAHGSLPPGKKKLTRVKIQRCSKNMLLAHGGWRGRERSRPTKAVRVQRIWPKP